MASGITVLDGGLSTQLEKEGAQFSGVLWTGRALLDQPELVHRAHRAFVEAGADIISTASYQLSRAGFLECGLSEQDADRALAMSVEVAKKAVEGTSARVAASIGPWGATLHDGSEYLGNYGKSQEFLENFHRERVAVLMTAKPDLCAVETIPEIAEARAVCGVMTEFPNMPFWISFSCSSPTQLASGEMLRDAIEAIKDTPGLIAVGVNCVPPDYVSSLVGQMRSVTDLPLVVYPNKGGTWIPQSGLWEGHNEKPLASWAGEWIEAGVSLVGGCCGHDASAIRELARSL
ncbi:MAG: hypothetical protein RL187_480 [Actinomycetota bacterium]|jgi:homocysteine S-methyltransferase